VGRSTAAGVDRDALRAQDVADRRGIGEHARTGGSKAFGDDPLHIEHAIDVRQLVAFSPEPVADRLGTARAAAASATSL
jgi:hypothetical protein